MPPDHDLIVNMLFFITFIGLMLILGVILFVLGPRVFKGHNDHAKAGVIAPTQH